jgi:hypothetical protein
MATAWPRRAPTAPRTPSSSRCASRKARTTRASSRCG